mmetsp:Transcript_65224/g.201942  ORF Transcript_65224/g.201942 Transcript_65224/m.201942 type:complete len:314 (-) Transcript_65224:42-983(-)
MGSCCFSAKSMVFCAIMRASSPSGPVSNCWMDLLFLLLIVLTPPLSSEPISSTGGSSCTVCRCWTSPLIECLCSATSVPGCTLSPSETVLLLSLLLSSSGTTLTSGWGENDTAWTLLRHWLFLEVRPLPRAVALLERIADFLREEEAMEERFSWTGGSAAGDGGFGSGGRGEGAFSCQGLVCAGSGSSSCAPCCHPSTPPASIQPATSSATLCATDCIFGSSILAQMDRAWTCFKWSLSWVTWLRRCLFSSWRLRTSWPWTSATNSSAARSLPSLGAEERSSASCSRAASAGRCRPQAQAWSPMAPRGAAGGR